MDEILHFFLSYLMAAWIIVYRVDAGRWPWWAVWLALAIGFGKEVRDWIVHPTWQEADPNVLRLVLESSKDLLFDFLGLWVAVEIWGRNRAWLGVFQ